MLLWPCKCSLQIWVADCDCISFLEQHFFLLEVLVAFLPPCPGCLFHILSYFQVPHPITLELLFPLYLLSWDLQPPALVCPWWSVCLLFCCHTALCCVLNSTSSSSFIPSFCYSTSWSHLARKSMWKAKMLSAYVSKTLCPHTGLGIWLALEF